MDRKKRSKYEAPGTSGRRRDQRPAVANSSAKMKREDEGKNSESNKNRKDAEGCFQKITPFLLEFSAQTSTSSNKLV